MLGVLALLVLYLTTSCIYCLRSMLGVLALLGFHNNILCGYQITAINVWESLQGIQFWESLLSNSRKHCTKVRYHETASSSGR